jgi:RNA polymerase sigma-70 factor (ECF subfamily)
VNVVNADARRTRFEAIAPALIEPLRRYLARRTDAATADDVLSETLLVCWRRLDDLPDDHLPWAYGVARNCLANAERTGRRQERLIARIAVLGDADDVTDGPDVPDDRVTQALRRLRAGDAELLRLWAWEELGPAEIAVTLGLTANAVSIRLHRARRKLRAELRKLDVATGHDQANEGRRR